MQRHLQNSIKVRSERILLQLYCFQRISKHFFLMFPNRNPYGFPSHNPYSGTRPDAAFTPTFMVPQSSFRSTRGQGLLANLRLRPVNGAEEHATSSGTTIVVQPGEPHNFGTTPDRRTPTIVNPLCRCQNPESHGNAWAFTGNYSWMVDTHGRRMSWKELANRVLDHCRKSL